MFFLVHRQVNSLQQQTNVGSPGHEQLPRFAPLPDRLSISQVQLAFQFIGVVATDALLLENGQDYIIENHSFIKRNWFGLCVAAQGFKQKIVAVGECGPVMTSPNKANHCCQSTKLGKPGIVPGLFPRPIHQRRHEKNAHTHPFVPLQYRAGIAIFTRQKQAHNHRQARREGTNEQQPTQKFAVKIALCRNTTIGLSWVNNLILRVRYPKAKCFHHHCQQ